ncbi:hypothetical protein E1B28_005037 [Marasmius oreades]|uniref:WW domain-containing protein n=1 Tax=Marasmius oreades TaxID=181124 RepID=A0A9P7UZY0_9AGAR|nr:uncharacterized protein E1B28_005037 [Marasmius oreades]KAG7097713.1 hypothetical protein E1B28_005037 [Marasmius oreades]
MQEENDVLDWEEDDEQQTQVLAAEDDADGVSLGSGSGDESEVHTVAESAEELITLPVAVSGQGDTSGVLRQATVPPPTSAQGDGSSKPHSRSSLQRRDPENNGFSDSTASPAAKGSRKKPKRTREHPTSTLPKVHGLPPKPVASTLAFLAPSHPSLTEATAMSQSKGKTSLPSVPSGNTSSRAIGDQRPHSSGSNTKSSSTKSNSGAEASLPPDWQVRHSRSNDAVYYYNTQTHESTWVKPVLERSDTNRERSALSFEDRHYRPGASDDTAGSSRHRSIALEAEVSPSTRKDNGPPAGDTWFRRSSFHNDEDGDSDDSYHGRPARNRRGHRSLSPTSPHHSKGVDVDTHATRRPTSQRQHDRVSRLALGDREQDFDHIISEHGHRKSGADDLQILDSDRHWAASDEIHSHSRQGYDHTPDSQKPATKSSRRHRPVSPQGLLSQAHGNRQHDHAETSSYEPFREGRKRNIYSSTASRSRDTDSREQRQPQSLSSTNRHRSQSPPHILITTTGLPPPPLAARNSATLTSSVSASTLGRRNKPSRFAPNSAASVPEDVDDWVPDEFRTEVMNDLPQDAENSRRERSSEPDRENREKEFDIGEERRHAGSRPERGRSASPTAPLASPDIPASRRKRQPLPPQSMRFREMTSGSDGIHRDPPSHRDRGDSSKLGPSLITPTATSINMRMDIDTTPSAPRAFDTLEPLPPSGPRGRSRSLDGDGSHARGRARLWRDRSRGRSRSYSRSRSRSKEREIILPREREREIDRLRRGDSTLELPRGPRAMEHHPVDSSSNDLQGRRPLMVQPPHLPVAPLPPVAPASRGRAGKGRGRRGREQVSVTGTNNIPVGTRGPIDTPAPAPRYSSQYDTVLPSVPPRGLTGGNVVPLKTIRNRGYTTQVDEDIVEPLRSYSRSRSRTPPRMAKSPVRRDERDGMEIDRAGRPARTRRDSFHKGRYDAPSFTSGYEVLPPIERTEATSRSWDNQSPAPLSPPRYRPREREERAATPPPSSRENSRVSPHDGRDRRRVDRHIRRNEDSMEDIRVSRDTDRDRGREERNAIADSGQDNKQNGYKMQHPLPMNPMLLRMGPSLPIQSSGPSTSPSTSYPRYRDRSPAPLPLISSGSRDGHAPSFFKDPPDSPPVPRQSKPPVKIRRPPPLTHEAPSSSSQREETLPRPAPMIMDKPDHLEPRRPSPRRGGSLLDRLSGGVGNSREENVMPSLKERVLVPSKRDRGELDEPMGPDRHEDYHAGNDRWERADDGGRGTSIIYEGGTGKRRRPRGGGSRKPRRSNRMPA